MKTHVKESVVQKLEKRLERLEQLMERRISSSTRRPFDELMERQWVKDSRATRDILQRTFGLVSKKRGRDWLKIINESRSAWK